MTPSSNERPQPLQNSESAHRRGLDAMARDFMRGKVLVAGVRLGVFDELPTNRDQAAMSTTDLATATTSDPTALRRLLRALAVIGVIDASGTDEWKLTERGQLLRRDAEPTAWASVVFWADLIADAWNYLDACIRKGDLSGASDAIEKLGTKSRWSVESDPTSMFHAAFAEPTAADNAIYVNACSFEAGQRVADLGGAGGGLLSAVLASDLSLHGILVDRDAALARARERFRDAEQLDRVELHAIDLLDAVPPSADRYLMRSLLHGYGDDDARRILMNCRRTMQGSTRLLLIEVVLPDLVPVEASNDERLALEAKLLSDLNMLAVTGGRERTVGEWRALLESAGLRIERVTTVPGNAHHSIIEASALAG